MFLSIYKTTFLNNLGRGGEISTIILYKLLSLYPLLERGKHDQFRSFSKVKHSLLFMAR